MSAELMSKDAKFTMHSRKDNWMSRITGMIAMASCANSSNGPRKFSFSIVTYVTSWSIDFEEFLYFLNYDLPLGFFVRFQLFL